MNGTEIENEWLSLSEYSSEYDVSVSTLRRRIKAKKIKCKLINGKYFLPKQISTPTSIALPPVPSIQATKSNDRGNEYTFNTAKSLLDELKKAYMQSLQGKEGQIIQLKQQISDLKTLVMYLERENSRLAPDRKN